MTKEANIISFKVIIDSKGLLMTEYSQLPRDKIKQCFNPQDTRIIRKAISKLEIEKEYIEQKEIVNIKKEEKKILIKDSTEDYNKIYKFLYENISLLNDKDIEHIIV